MKISYYLFVIFLCFTFVACEEDEHRVNPNRPSVNPPTEVPRPDPGTDPDPGTNPDPDPEPTDPPEPPVVDPNRRIKNIAFNIDGNYIRAGRSRTGAILYNIDGNYIRTGENRNGGIAYNIDGNYIKAGSRNDGTPLFYIEDKNIYAVYRDEVVNGSPVFTVNGDSIMVGSSIIYGNDKYRIYDLDFSYSSNQLSTVKVSPPGGYLHGISLYWIDFDYSADNKISRATVRTGVWPSGTTIYTIYFTYSSDELNDAEVYVGYDRYAVNYSYKIDFNYSFSKLTSAKVYKGSKIVYEIEFSNSFIWDSTYPNGGYNQISSGKVYFR